MLFKMMIHQKWKLVMDKEMKSLELNDKFKLIDLPEPSKLVSGKCMYSIREDPDNPSFKARFETSWPTICIESIITLRQLAVNYGLVVHQINVKSAYLYARIDCDIYVCQPKGYEVLNKKDKPMVLKLNKYLYGFK